MSSESQDPSRGKTAAGQHGPGSTNRSQPLEATEQQLPAAREKAKRRSQVFLQKLPEVPGYCVVRLLGEGTYGTVCLAEEEHTGIRVAIKFFNHGAGLEWQLMQAEVKQLALMHADPGIVQLKDVNPGAIPPYYIMAYAEGGSLSQRLAKGPLPLLEAMRIFRQVAEALAYVHAKGIRHCDLKPGNILLDSRGRALIADFGQAHFSSDATPALGTFFYMAPEQADLAHQIPDTRWDVYGLGALFYAMLVGRPPRQEAPLLKELENTTILSHRLKRYREWIYQADRPMEHHRLLGMDKPLAEILDRCLEIQPERRFHDAGAVLEGLARRERQRRQRALLSFGVLAPLVLLVAMSGLGSVTLTESLQGSQEVLIRRLLESDQVSADLVANVVQQELLTRQNLLEKQARDPRLREAARTKDRSALADLMKQFNLGNGEHGFLAWLIVDQDGNLLALERNLQPLPGQVVPDHFAWRDWFNGQGDNFDHQEDHFPPIRHTHVAQPYAGRIIKDNLTGISTPVFDPKDDQAIVAVLYTPIKIEELYSLLERVRIENGFLVLVDRQGHCLLHQEKEKIKGQYHQPTPRWESPVYHDACEHKGMAAYQDPVDGRYYLAGYAPLPDVGWGALVQHEREAALKPVAEVRNTMVLFGVVSLFTAGLLISGIWGLLVWTLRREERLSHG